MALHLLFGARQVRQNDRQHDEEAQQVGDPVEHDGVDAEQLDAVSVDDRVAGDQRSRRGAPAHAIEAARAAERREIALCGDQADPGDDGEQSKDALRAGCFPQNNECTDGRQQRPGAARDWVDHREIGDLIAALQAKAVGQMNAGAEHEAGRDGQAPVQFAVNQEPDHPWQIDDAGEHIIGEDEGRAGVSGALGEQIPCGVDEGGEDNEGEREQRHETSVPSGANKISTSPPLGFCPSGAAACYRGFRNARTGDGGLAIRNPSCHSVDKT